MTIYPRSTRAIALLLCLLLSAPEILSARVQPTTGSNMFTIDQEIQAGKEAVAQTNRQYPVLPDSSPVTQYIQQLGRRLVQYAPGEKWPYQFHVVNQKEINAFALPGGPLYVNVGTIQAADNEAQLAGVMSHELSHIIQRHSTRAATKQYKAQVGLGILGAILGGSAGGQLAAAGISFAAGSYFLKNSRQSEKEADLLGTDIMYDAGYDPIQLPRFFEKIEAEGSQGPQFLSDHPNPGNRVAYCEAEVQTLPPKRFHEDSPQFAEIHRLVMNMHPLTAQQIAAQDQRGGFNPNGVSDGSTDSGGSSSGGQAYSVSTSFQQLSHSAFTIGYPSNWKVFGDAQSAVTIAPQNGVGQDSNGQGAVAVGVIIDSYEGEQGTALDQATRDLIASLRQSNPDLRQVGNDEAIRVNGVSGRSADLIGNSPLRDNNQRAQRERDWLVAIGRQDGTVLYLVFIAPQNQFDQLRPTYEQMLRTVRLR
jgi:beta-barrel assembly-enhancing protease